MKLSSIPNYLDISTHTTQQHSLDLAPSVQQGERHLPTKQIAETLALIPRQHEARKVTEQYIADKFAQVHQAHIEHFLPYLISVKHAGQPAAAIGIQPGHQGAMFLEQYLTNPVEQQIAALEKQPVSRDQIVEIGNLVVSYKPAGFMLFLIIASALSQAGFKWMTFTATPVVEKMIQRLGYSPYHLAEAKADCLGEAAEQWGQYYARQPRVMVGNLDDAQAHIRACAILSKLIAPVHEQIKHLASEMNRVSKRG